MEQGIQCQIGSDYRRRQYMYELLIFLACQTRLLEPQAQ